MTSRLRSMLSRQWELVVTLSERRRGATIRQIGEVLSSSRATVYRDLEVLLAIGVPIRRERVNGEVRYSLDGDSLPPLRPTSMQVAALHLARRMMSPLEGTRIVHEFDAVLAHLTPELRLKPETGIELSTRSQPHHPSTVQCIDRAIYAGKRIRFQYQATGQDAPAPRRCDPVALRHLEHHLYLIAWDLDREDWRIFKLTRLTDVDIVDEPADAHPEYDEQVLFAHSVKIWAAAPVVVAVRLAPSVARFATEWPLAPGQTVSPQDDGTAIVSAEVAGTIEAMRWVLSWGRNAEVLAPSALRQTVRAELEAAAAVYRDEVSHET